MILKKLKEAKQIDDITLTPEEKAFADEVKDLDPLFSGLRNNSIKVLRNIWLSDQNGDFDNNPNGFLDWFYEQYADFGDFVVKEYERIPQNEGRSSKDSLPVFVIRDLALNDEVFANALRQIALEWNCIDENNYDVDTGSKVDIEDIVEILFLQCCSVGVHASDIDSTLPDEAPYKYKTDPKTDLTPEERAENKAWLDKRYPDKNVRSPRLLKDLVAEIAEKIKLTESVHVCEKCGHSPCICEAEEKEDKEETPEPIDVISETPVEPVPAISEPHEDVPESVFTDMINDVIQKEWEFISQVNSLIATFDFDYKGDNKEDLTTIFNQLIDDTTINVGMLHKAAELVSSKQAELIDAGEEKAEQVISEPSQDLE